MAAARLGACTPTNKWITALRTAASTCGAEPLRTRQWSSPNVVSRT